MQLENKPDIDRLWELYQADRDPEIKNQILTHYLFLVKNIVRRIMPKYKNYNESDDLISCGIIGLIDAVDKYDINYGVKFEIYAAARVRGEILDYMRRQDWAPPSLRKKINAVNQAYEELEGKSGRVPTEQEVADRVEMPVSEVRKVLNKAHMFNLMYFEDMITDTYAIGKAAEYGERDPAELAEKKEVSRILGEMIDGLPEKERLVISLYYYEEMTLKEISEILNVSESRVSQIHSKVLARLGYKLGKLI